MPGKTRILSFIVIAQFFCTSLWFAGNAVMNNLISAYGLNDSALGQLTSAVQLGFISGTLVFALLTIADRFSPSKVFFVCSILGAVFNIAIIFDQNTYTSILVFRFLTGFTLAGIYPVGMKIAADHFQKGLGKSLGFLVGALVLGTAFPHLVKAFTTGLPWKTVMIFTSILDLAGGLLIRLFVPDGPHRKQASKFDFTALFSVFKYPNFRQAAFGYFGHMWELYTFWAFVPVILMSFVELNPQEIINIPVWSFIIIGLGSLACIIGGYISLNVGVKLTATSALFLSLCCCLLSPFIILSGSKFLLLGYMIFWGLVVIADSPLFSTLVAQNAPEESKGTALTIVNSIGFAITIFSILFINYLRTVLPVQYVFIFLSIGPALGIINLIYKRQPSPVA
ncbi:MFS transporter [Marinigracilibium pacificum]|uniref:MFS transporter n=1 Tax=Marinigracilibium pacificum TaxID=2729599 RepID=A0A848IZC5_9BACT|nr:MFS transporter [Marinigracilibium pacificum]NMM48498.1 MFS transporter [Marinigracilibium pacificum]